VENNVNKAIVVIAKRLNTKDICSLAQKFEHAREGQRWYSPIPDAGTAREGAGDKPARLPATYDHVLHKFCGKDCEQGP
jgi:hypothetical protein